MTLRPDNLGAMVMARSQEILRPTSGLRNCDFSRGATWPARLAVIGLVILSAGMLLAREAQARSTPGSARVKVLVLGLPAETFASTDLISEALRKTHSYEVFTNELNRGINRELLAGIQVVVLGPGCLPEVAERKALESWTESGGGLVITGFDPGHAGGTGRLAGVAGGVHSSGDLPRNVLLVKISEPGHAITRDLKSFIAVGPLPSVNLAPDAQVLGRIFSDSAKGGTSRDEPVIWVRTQGKGRVYCTTLGSDAAAAYEAGFLTTLVRGVEWAATGSVSSSVLAAGWSMGDNPLRVMVVTGGHRFESSFYTLFEGYSDISWWHSSPNTAAFEKDFRNACDVLVLYDLSREIGESQKTNLRNFVESGKGIVVLHHAIADYNDWPWWYEEVVGGKYYLKPEGGRPASLFAKDQDLISEAAGPHPITAGIAPLHTIEETYKGMWISPSVEPLLVTSNPTSDSIVGWISPYARSRVVYIELGHDRKTHLHPGYRRLIRNAILWSGGRLP